MKILHVYKTFINDTMGGTEQVIAQLGKEKASVMEHTVLSLTPQSSDIIEGMHGIKNIRFKEQLSIASNSMSLELLRAFPKLTKDYDVIHYHFPWPFADLLHWIWRIKKPSVVTYHSDVVRQQLWLRLYQPLMHQFLKSVQAIVATSPQYLITSPILHKYREKTSVIPIGIERNNYPTVSTERLEYWRQKFGERFFLFVGVLRYYKGLPILLEAVQHTNYPLLIVGQGPCEQELKAQTQRLNLSNVHFLGNISEEDKIALLQLCLAFVFPSTIRSEAFGVSLLEAAMLGKPMISTELGTGTSYINIDKSTGIVVPPSDVSALRGALTYIWSHPEEASVMGKEATLRHQSLFTAQQMREGYEAIYRRLG